MNVNVILIALAAPFAVACLSTALMRRLSLRCGFVSVPRPDRYNQNIVSLGGGIAIFFTICSFAIIGCISSIRFGVPSEIALDYAVIISMISALFMLGFCDDIFSLSPSFKLVVQFLVAITAALFADVRVDFFIHNKIITTILSVFWIVFLINAFNFLDNMDGLCAGVAAISLSVLCSAAIISGEVVNAVFMLIVIGTLGGFLVFNFPPAKIFMGDAGSMVIGFSVAAMTMKTTYYHQASDNQSPSAVLIPIVAMAVPLYDFVSVTLLRLKQGKSPFVGDTQHFSHRLGRRGLNDKQVALTLYLATICTGLGAVFLSRATIAEALLILIQTIMILLIIAILETTEKK